MLKLLVGSESTVLKKGDMVAIDFNESGATLISVGREGFPLPFVKADGDTDDKRLIGQNASKRDARELMLVIAAFIGCTPTLINESENHVLYQMD